MDNLELVGISIAAISAIAAIYNIRVMVISIKKDHDRRSKQATFEYVGEKTRNTLTAIDEILNFKKISSSQCEEIFSNKNKSVEMLRLLGTLEHISVGTNIGVYDKKVLFSMSSSYIVDIYIKVNPYIIFLRKRLDTMEKPAQQLYSEFEKLALEFKEQI